MNQDDVGALLRYHVLHSKQNRICDVEKILPCPHHGQVVVGCDGKNLENLFEHLAMLTAHAHAYIELVRSVFQLVDKRAHFYRFGTRPEHE